MYFGIIKIRMDNETTNAYSYAEAINICESIRSRFKALARPYEQKMDESELTLTIVLLEGTQEKLKQKSEEIFTLIENKGLGRILEHEMICEHVEDLEFD
jgi:hypothetical protein